MKKKITAYLYTESKTVWEKHQFVTLYNDDGALFSHGRYKTKIIPEDLPEWYVKGSYYRQVGYLSAKNIKYLLYKPNYFTNHMFKDDFLYVSYDKPITPIPGDFALFEGYDEYIWGGTIPRFVESAKGYSNYPVAEIEVEMEKKRLWFKETYPEFYHLEVGAK